MSFDYPWSDLTLQLRQLLSTGVGLTIHDDEMVVLQDAVEGVGFEDCPPDIAMLAGKLVSGVPLNTRVPLPEHFGDFHEVLLTIDAQLPINLCDYGEWLLWHLPGFGYGFFASLSYPPLWFTTSKRYLQISYEDAQRDL